MLSDPTKLRTRRGVGYLVGRRDVFSGQDEQSAAELTQRLLDEPGNEAALREALGLGPDADREVLAEWLRTALAGGSRVCVRTKRAPPTFDEPKATDLVDLIDPRKKHEPQEQTTTWMELRIVDELGEALPDIAVRISAGETHTASTDSNGVVRIDDASTSFGRATLASAAALHDSLRQRWSQPRDTAWLDVEEQPEVTVVPATDPLPEVALRAKTPHTLVFQPRVARVRIVGEVFDTNKAFVLPDALPLLREVVALYAQHPKAQMLVLGHTDTSGEPHINDPLSLQRAEAVVAYLSDDVDTWLAFFESAVASSQRWGEREEGFLLEQALWARGEVPEGNAVGAYQASRGLTVDGDIGPDTRRALIEDYMALDGSTLPSGVEALAHGCGENFPLADDGESLDVSPPDGVDDPTDRRVEVLFFDAPLGILPAPPLGNSAAGGMEYLTWCRRARMTQDMLVIRPLALAVRVSDEDSQAVVSEASVSLQGVDLLGAAPTGATDNFGVRTFVNIVAGAYRINVEKPGYEPGSVTHVVVPGAPAAVIVVRLAPERTVNLQLTVVGPAGERIALAEGVQVSLTPDEGTVAEGTSTDDGRVTLRAGATTGQAALALSLGDAPCLVRSIDGSTRLASLDDALAASEQGAAFIQMPATFAPTSARIRLDQRLSLDDEGTFDLATALKHSRDGDLQVDIVPAWEHLAFSFFDRHHGRPRSVPGARAEGQPSLVLTGHPLGADGPIAHTAWPIEAGGRTVHALAWFPDPGHVPLPEDTVRMLCPARTYAVSDRDDPTSVVLEVVPATGPRADLVDQPTADRLFFYDVPAVWQGDRYFGRRASEGPDLTRLYSSIARQTSAHDPILVSLDDIVLMRSDGAGGRHVVSVETNFSVLDNAMEVYRPNHTVPEGYGEPYFTDKTLLSSVPGAGEVPGYVLLDTPDFTRAVVYRQIHDVFDMRTDTSDAVGPPVGARVAYTPFSGESVTEEIEQTSKFFQVVGEFQVDGPGNFGDPPQPEPGGRSMAVVMRCCGVAPSGIEDLALLQFLRVKFDFSPAIPPPAGATAPTARSKSLSPAEQNRISAQAIDAAGSRWNGADSALAKKKFIDPVEGTAADGFKPVATAGATLEIGNPPTQRCLHRVLFVRNDRATKPVNGCEIEVRLWGSVRASMGPGVRDWALSDLRAHTAWSTVAHELGHALGLPDEYAEPDHHASLRLMTICDSYASEGRPYVFDEKSSSQAFSSIMTTPEQPRPRHYFDMSVGILGRLGLQSSLCRVGASVYAPFSGTAPSNSFLANGRAVGVKIDGNRTCDAFLYVAREGGFALRRFGDASLAGVLLLRVRLGLAFPPSVELPAQEASAGALGATLKKVAAEVGCVMRLRYQGQAMRVRVVLSPRVLSLVCPTNAPTAELRKETNVYLGKLNYRSRVGDIYQVRPVFSSKAAENEEARLRQSVAALRKNIARVENDIQQIEESTTEHKIVPKEVQLGLLRNTLQQYEDELEAAEAELASFEARPPGDPAWLARESYEALVQAMTADNPLHASLDIGDGHAKSGPPSPPLRTFQLPGQLSVPKNAKIVKKVMRRILGAPVGTKRFSATEKTDLLRGVLDNMQGVDFVELEESK